MISISICRGPTVCAALGYRDDSESVPASDTLGGPQPSGARSSYTPLSLPKQMLLATVGPRNANVSGFIFPHRLGALWAAYPEYGLGRRISALGRQGKATGAGVGPSSPGLRKFHLKQRSATQQDSSGLPGTSLT